MFLAFELRVSFPAFHGNIMLYIRNEISTVVIVVSVFLWTRGVSLACGRDLRYAPICDRWRISRFYSFLVWFLMVGFVYIFGSRQTMNKTTTTKPIGAHPRLASLRVSARCAFPFGAASKLPSSCAARPFRTPFRDHIP